MLTKVASAGASGVGCEIKTVELNGNGVFWGLIDCHKIERTGRLDHFWSKCNEYNFLSADQFPKHVSLSVVLACEHKFLCHDLHLDLLYRLNLLPFFARSILKHCTNSSHYFIDPPKILPISFGTKVLNSGAFAQVSCIVTEGDEPLTISWSFHGASIGSELGIVTTPNRHRGLHVDYLQCGPQTLRRVHMHSQQWGGL